MQGKHLQQIKASNRAVVLDFIRQYEPVSRRRISLDLQLSPTTASSAVADLLKTGFVRESGHGVSTGGRRPMMLEINSKGGTIIAVDMVSKYGNRVLRAAALDLKCNPLTEIRHELEIDGNEEMIKAIQNIIIDLINSPNVMLKDAVAIGISVPGLVNAETGEIVLTKINVHDFRLGESLSSTFKAPVIVQNTEDAAAMGEYRFGIGQGVSSLIFLSIGAGNGAGLLINGNSVYHGRTSGGELGHMTVQADGPLCWCGNRGCLTSLVTSNKLVRKVKAGIDDGYRSEHLPADKDLIDIKTIMRAAEADDPLCREIVTDAAGFIGVAVTNLINFLNPEMILFGGEFFDENRFFFDLVKEEARRRSLTHYFKSVQLAPSSLGGRAGLRGVAVLALDQLLQHP